jgi:hypothetical protein
LGFLLEVCSFDVENLKPLEEVGDAAAGGVGEQQLGVNDKAVVAASASDNTQIRL